MNNWQEIKLGGHIDIRHEFYFPIITFCNMLLPKLMSGWIYFDSKGK